MPILDNLTQDAVRVLRAISSLGQATRLSIINRTGLSKGRTTAAVQELRDQGLIVSREEAPQGQGRPSFIHTIAPDAFYAVGAALKVGACSISVVSGTGDILENRSLPTSSGAFEEQELLAVLADVRAGVRDAISRLEPARFIALGISVLGRVDTEQGVWLSGLQYGPFRNVNVPAQFSDLGVPVVVEDHARSVAFAEIRRRGGSPGEDFALLYMGEGLGSALVLDGRLYRGRHGVVGEIGHVALEGNDKRCVCGDTGCLETVASGTGILSSLRARIAEGVVTTLRARVEGGETLSLSAIGEAATAHDRLAEQVLQEAGTALGEACSLVMKMVNPARIIVSGEAATLSESLAEPMNRRIRERAPLEARLDFGTGFARYTENDEAVGVALLSIDRTLSERVAPGPPSAEET